MPKKRERRNEHERALDELAERNGWRATKRGWPDFLCFNRSTGEIIAVEVKPRIPSGRMKALRADQAACMDFLKSKGIRCFVSDGSTLEPYDRQKHREDRRRKP